MKVGLFIAIAVANLSLAFAAPPAPGPPQTLSGGAFAFGVHYDPAAGPFLYEAHCAACHDHPSGRTPSRAVIATNPPLDIFQVLNDGIMRPYASDLSGAQRLSIAEFVSQNKDEGATARNPDPPKCARRSTSVRLLDPGWNGWGHDTYNLRYQPDPGLIASDLPRLKLKWAMAMHGNRSAQPVLTGRRLFINSSAKSVYSLDAITGCMYWRFDAQAGVRNTLSLAQIRDRKGSARTAAFFIDALGSLYALDAARGVLIWRSQIDRQPGHEFTGSVAIDNGVVFAPVSSGEEAYAANDAYECCKFRGALIAVRANSGRILWTAHTSKRLPTPFKRNREGVQMFGPAGGAIWSAPTIDSKRGLIYVVTGDSYTDIPYDGADSVMAFSMKRGDLVWKNQLTGDDSYIIGCDGPVEQRHANCPTSVGGDFDLGASPALASLSDGKDLIIASQKSGQVYALNPDAQGQIIWEKRLSPGGPLGGSEFGHAVDGKNVYVGIVDMFIKDAARPQLTALRLSDGAMIWSQPMLPRPCPWSNVYCNPGIAMAVTAMPGAVFAGRMDGLLGAYSSSDGKLLWSFDTARTFSTVNGTTAGGGVLDGPGPIIGAGMVFVNSGWAGRSGPGSILLAFSIDGS